MARVAGAASTGPAGIAAASADPFGPPLRESYFRIGSSGGGM